MSMVSTSIARDAAVITKSDTADNTWSYLYVGGAGDVKITTEAGTALVYPSVPAGSYIWVRTRLVWSTGTTATLMVGHR